MRIFFLLFFIYTLTFGDETLKIATYNVQNLFDLQKSGHEYREYIPYSHSKWNKKNYSIKLQNLSRVIKDIDADIIALEEIESLQALKDLRYALKQKGLYYQYYKIANQKSTTIKVALLSKIPFVYTKELRVTSSYRYRNILEAKFKLKNQEFYIFVNHWKAKSGPESQRIVSAKILRKRVQTLGYDKNIILLGDFNSDYEEYKRFRRDRRLNDTHGRTGINDVLRTKTQNKKSFYNLWYDIPKEARYSYIYRGKKEALDNILISQPLLHDNNAMYYKKNSIHSFKASYLFKKRRIYRWQMSRKKPRKHTGKGYSDHLGVIAEFFLKGETTQSHL